MILFIMDDQMLCCRRLDELVNEAQHEQWREKHDSELQQVNILSDCS